MSKAAERRLRRMEKHTLIPQTPHGALQDADWEWIETYHAWLSAFIDPDRTGPADPEPSDAHLSRAAKKRIKEAYLYWGRIYADDFKKAFPEVGGK